MNLRPSGYEPDELPTAPSRDISSVMYYRFCVCKDKTNIRTLQIILRMFPPHTAYRTIYQPQKIFYYFSKVSPTLIFPQISYHPEQGRMKTHTPSADPIRNTHRHSQSADIGYDNLRQVADFPFRTAPDGFFAKRAGRDDHLGTGSFQLPGHGFCDLPVSYTHLTLPTNSRV